MMADETTLKENFRGFRLMATCIDLGVPLDETVLILEEEFQASPLKNKFKELIEYVAQNRGAPPRAEWNSDYFLTSTKAFFAHGFTVGAIDGFLKPALELICIKLHYEKEGIRDKRIDVCDFYLLSFLRHELRLDVALSCLERELPELVASFDFNEKDELFSQSKESTKLYRKTFSPDLAEILQQLNSVTSIEGLSLSETLFNQKRKKLLALLHIENRDSDRENERSSFYYNVYLELKSEKYIHEIFEMGLSKIQNEEFFKNWQNIAIDLAADPQEGLDTLEGSSLSLKEKLFLKYGFIAGDLGKAFYELARLVKNPYSTF